jgi:peroxiredoxin
MKIVLAITFFALLIFPVSCQKKQQEQQMQAELNKKAPPFTLKDMNRTDVSLADFVDKVVVIDFWASWCHACKLAAPVLEKLYQKYQNRDVIILGISLDSGFKAEENVRDFIKEYHQTYPILWDDERTSTTYGIRMVPTTFLLDKDHVIVKEYAGLLPRFEEDLDEQIERLLADQKIE